MFTGIITDIGVVKELINNGDTRIVIQTAYETSTINFGASMADVKG